VLSRKGRGNQPCGIGPSVELDVRLMRQRTGNRGQRRLRATARWAERQRHDLPGAVGGESRNRTAAGGRRPFWLDPVGTNGQPAGAASNSGPGQREESGQYRTVAACQAPILQSVEAAVCMSYIARQADRPIRVDFQRMRRKPLQHNDLRAAVGVHAVSRADNRAEFAGRTASNDQTCKLDAGLKIAVDFLASRQIRELVQVE